MRAANKPSVVQFGELASLRLPAPSCLVSPFEKMEIHTPTFLPSSALAPAIPQLESL